MKAKIIENKKIAEGFYRMRIGSSYLAAESVPGQFVEVKCSDRAEPFLRRPLGIHRINRSGIDMLYEAVGRGTEILSRRKSGDYLDIIGPLGTGFDLEPSTIDHRPSAILVAGGVGVAPLPALAEHLAISVERLAGSRKRIYVLIGACKKEHVLCEKEFKKLGAMVMVATEDGSKGHKGLVTEALTQLLSTIDYRLSIIYACGPVGMLKAVAGIAQKQNVPCQVSLEERMACGVGVCLGCPVKVKLSPGPGHHGTKYKMVCKDGPVFDAKEIEW